MTLLTERLTDLAGTESGIDPAAAITLGRRRQRRARATSSLCGAAVLLALGGAATRLGGPDTVDVTTASTATTTGDMSGPYDATTPDGIELTWEVGTFGFARCFLDVGCGAPGPDGLVPNPGVEVRFSMPDGRHGTQAAPVSSTTTGSPVHVGASWGSDAGPWFVAVRSELPVETLRLVRRDGLVDTRRPTGPVTVFAVPAGPIIGVVEALDASGNTIASCVAVENATGCH
jgi:hypothetical protein